MPSSTFCLVLLHCSTLRSRALSHLCSGFYQGRDGGTICSLCYHRGRKHSVSPLSSSCEMWMLLLPLVVLRCLQGIHHLALVCKDMKETVTWSKPPPPRIFMIRTSLWYEYSYILLSFCLNRTFVLSFVFSFVKYMVFCVFILSCVLC